MATLRENIEKKLRERVCANCYATLPDGSCNLGGCPIFARLDEIIEIVSSIRDYSIDPYLDRLRTIICATCEQHPDGRCLRRDALDCGLSMYFPMVVEIIEEELYKEGSSTTRVVDDPAG